MQFDPTRVPGLHVHLAWGPDRGDRHELLIAVIAQVIGVLLGLLAALAGRSRNLVVKGLSGLYVWFFRGTPVLVQIFLLYYGLPACSASTRSRSGTAILPELIGGAFLAGTLALGVNEGAYMSEIIRAGILSVDSGQAEAAKSLGMTPRKTMSRIVLPQALRVIIPPLGNEFNNMLKTTSLASVIGVTELLLLAQNRYGGDLQAVRAAARHLRLLPRDDDDLGPHPGPDRAAARRGPEPQRGRARASGHA